MEASINNQSVQAIILAAGKGTRMNSLDLPKVLFPLGNKPLLSHVIDYLTDSGILSPIIVVGYLKEKVIEVIGSKYRYVTQNELTGTATCVKSARPALEEFVGTTVIASGDQPFISTNSIRRLISEVTENGATLSLLVGNFNESHFDAFGRVILNSSGTAERIVEAKNATELELTNRLFNLATYAVDNTWLWQAIDKIEKNPLTGEYYLTDLVEIAAKEDKKVTVVITNSLQEATGINTAEHLNAAQELLN